MQNELGRRRQTVTGLPATGFAALVRSAGCLTMTPARLYRIEEGLAKATPKEKEVISALLGVKTWELQR